VGKKVGRQGFGTGFGQMEVFEGTPEKQSLEQRQMVKAECVWKCDQVS